MKKLFLSLILSLFFVDAYATLPHTEDVYRAKARRLSEALKDTLYSTQDFHDYLNRVHTVDSGIPYVRNGNSFFKKLFQQFAWDMNTFYARYLNNHTPNNERFLNFLVGAVNVLKTDHFSVVFPEGSQEREDTMKYVGHCLQTTASLPNISNRMKNALGRSKLFFGVQFFEELFSYSYPDAQGNDNVDRQRWLQGHWGRTDRYNSLYTNVLKVRLIELGYEVENPNQYALELLNETAVQRNRPTVRAARTNGAPTARPISLMMRRGKNEHNQLYRKYQDLERERLTQERHHRMMATFYADSESEDEFPDIHPVENIRFDLSVESVEEQEQMDVDVDIEAFESSLFGEDSFDFNFSTESSDTQYQMNVDVNAQEDFPSLSLSQILSGTLSTQPDDRIKI
ncbi:MAG: hypothetical protein GY915_07990, partial [bacterium]|nr:hypothetical protein [bacterium]